MSCLSASSVHVGPLATPGTGSAAEGPPVVSVVWTLTTQRAGEPRRARGPGQWQWELHLCSTRRAWEARQGCHAREAGPKEAVEGVQVWAAGRGCGQCDGGGKGHAQV